MNVHELKEWLEGVPGNTLVVLGDFENAQGSPLCTVSSNAVFKIDAMDDGVRCCLLTAVNSGAALVDVPNLLAEIDDRINVETACENTKGVETLQSLKDWLCNGD